MDGIVISMIDTRDAAYYEVVQLRDEVLRIPLGRSIKNDDLSRDETALIFTASKENRVIGCVLFQPLDAGVMKLRAMAVTQSLQGNGIGRMLVQAAERAAREAGYSSIELHARMVVAAFYTALGYLPTGEIFTEVGIPHIKMLKDLA